MITEDFVSFEIAKLLKEKGFNEATYHDYAPNGARWFEEVLVQHNSQGGVACPTLQMAMKWLREVHNLHISVNMGFDVDNSQYFFYVPFVCRFSNKDGEYLTPFDEKEFGSYEEACEATIKYCLENLI